MLRIGISKVVLDKVVSAITEDSLTFVRSLRNSPVTSRGTTSAQLLCKILYLRYGISCEMIMFYELFIITLSIQLRKYNRKEKLQRKGLVSQQPEMRISYWPSWNEVEKRTCKREEKKIGNWVLYKNFKTQCIRQNRKKLKKNDTLKVIWRNVDFSENRSKEGRWSTERLEKILCSRPRRWWARVLVWARSPTQS